VSRHREQLLGYLLGALDEAEQRAVQRELEANPQLREELEQLRQMLEPLEELREEFEPPADLASRTCRLVAAAENARVPAPAPPLVDQFASVHSASLLDVVVAAGICVALSLLFFPAILKSRELARRTMCADNLRQAGFALAAYDDTYHSAPAIPNDGPAAFAGYYAVSLRQADLLTDYRVLLCPGANWPRGEIEFRIPRVEEVLAATGATLTNLQRIAGGSYGYNIGYWDGRTYRAPRVPRGSTILVMTDAPDPSRPSMIGGNHGGQGMNVLFEDARVVFLRGSTIPIGENGRSDHAFLNHDGQIARGLGRDDSVIASSETRPRE